MNSPVLRSVFLTHAHTLVETVDLTLRCTHTVIPPLWYLEGEGGGVATLQRKAFDFH